MEGKTEGRLAAILNLFDPLFLRLFDKLYVCFFPLFVVLSRSNMYHTLVLCAVLSIFPEYSVSLRFAYIDKCAFVSVH